MDQNLIELHSFLSRYLIILRPEFMDYRERGDNVCYEERALTENI